MSAICTTNTGRPFLRTMQSWRFFSIILCTGMGRQTGWTSSKVDITRRWEPLSMIWWTRPWSWPRCWPFLVLLRDLWTAWPWLSWWTKTLSRRNWTRSRTPSFCRPRPWPGTGIMFGRRWRRFLWRAWPTLRYGPSCYPQAIGWWTSGSLWRGPMWCITASRWHAAEWSDAFSHPCWRSRWICVTLSVRQCWCRRQWRSAST